MGLFTFDEKNVIEFIRDLPLLYCEEYCISFFLTAIEKFDVKDATIMDKINIYQNIWKNTLNVLYEQYLPSLEIPVDNGVEFTPFTFRLSSLWKNNLVELFELSSEDILVLENLLNETLADYPNVKTVGNKANIMLGISMFPPIMQLNYLYQKAYDIHSKYTKRIFEIVNNQKMEIPPYQTNLGLGFAHNFFSQKTYRKYGEMHGLIANPSLRFIKEKLIKIKDECADEATLNKNSICPFCGEAHRITAKKEDIFFAHLVKLHSDVLVDLGFVFYDEFLIDISNEFTRIFTSLPQNINEVKGAKCIILVEGDTEEIALPSMAIKLAKPLSTEKIHVWNSKSKQKVVMDFVKIKDNFPDMKICALLDSDAIKEANELERLTKGKKDKYSFKRINKGTFEDLIPISISVQALNELYELEKPIEIQDIDESKEIVRQFEKILYDLGSVKFDKVVFAKKVLSLMKYSDVPQLICELIEDAYKFIGK